MTMFTVHGSYKVRGGTFDITFGPVHQSKLAASLDTLAEEFPDVPFHCQPVTPPIAPYVIPAGASWLRRFWIISKALARDREFWRLLWRAVKGTINVLFFLALFFAIWLNMAEGHYDKAALFMGLLVFFQLDKINDTLKEKNRD